TSKTAGDKLVSDPSRSGSLKSHLDAAAQRASLTRENEAAFIGRQPRDRVEQVAAIDDGFRTERHAKCRQALRHIDAQTRIVDRQATFEWIDREDRSLGRESKNSADARTRLEIGRKLRKQRLEESALKHMRRLAHGVR